jgi:hypothetical protein
MKELKPIFERKGPRAMQATQTSGRMVADDGSWA